jgi:hypothetical protein
MLVGLLLGVPAIALAQNDIYDNGPINGTVDAWTINFGFVVSNSFTISPGADISGISFGAWLNPGDTLTSAEVSITSNELGGTSYFDQVVNFSQSGCAVNLFGYNICTETASIGPYLNAGTYWLNLQNASVPSGDPVYWDENSGPSRASENTLGTLPSESFTIFGGGITCGVNGPDCGPPSPEPGSLLLFGSGALVALAALRRRLF